MKKYILAILLPAIILTSCSEYSKVVKSNDYALKYKKAKEYYEKRDYTRALALLEAVSPVYKGTDKDEEVQFYIAYAHHGLGEYILSGFYFREFVKSFPNSKHREECDYMGAYCYYLDSPRYSLDQTSSKNAITDLQAYLNRYPNTTRKEECTKIIEEMQHKLAEKSFYSAKLYFDIKYDIRYCRSACIALKASLKDYPDSPYREETMYLIIKAAYVLAENSIESKQEDRYKDVIKEYYPFLDEFPKSKHMKEVDAIFKDTEKKISKLQTSSSNL